MNTVLDIMIRYVLPRMWKLAKRCWLRLQEVAMLEISGYYEVGNSVDHNRNMRLDVDHMSYEVTRGFTF